MRFAKILRFGRTRTDIGVDINNLFNTNYATGFNQTYIYTTDNTPRAGRLGHADWPRVPAVRASELHGELLATCRVRSAGLGLRCSRSVGQGTILYGGTGPFAFALTGCPELGPWPRALGLDLADVLHFRMAMEKWSTSEPENPLRCRALTFSTIFRLPGIP